MYGEKKCKISGLSLEFGKAKHGTTTASLDRIDSSKGYIEGNVQWLHKDVNRSKFTKSDEEFIELCRIIVGYNNDKNS